jgi:dipeptide transport system ATP-binding protein
MSHLLNVQGAKKYYQIKTGLGKTATVKSVNGISFEIGPQETLGVVGESGCGKSTLARLVQGLEAPTSGEVLLNGKNIDQLKTLDRVSLVQMIFQDPYNSLNPRKKAFEIIALPLLAQQKVLNLSKLEIEKRVLETMEKVGLPSSWANKYPHMFSGGQRQRLGIARAIITRPKLIICDEPVSALDVSVQAQILNLLVDLQAEFHLSYMFISHDLFVINHISDKIMVMYLGEVVEFGPASDIFENPQHPYTRLLLQSLPQMDKQSSSPSTSIEYGKELPSVTNPPTGCSFNPRCPFKTDRCESEKPQLSSRGRQMVSCFHLDNIPPFS